MHGVCCPNLVMVISPLLQRLNAEVNVRMQKRKGMLATLLRRTVQKEQKPVRVRMDDTAK